MSTKNTNNTVSSHTRATRSRFSSPQTAANGATDSSSRAQGNGTTAGGSSGSGANGVEGQKTFMQRWLEPPVQVKASYQDAGLVRQGVFENMAPLGTLPKVGIFKKTAPAVAATPEHAPVRRIVVIKPRASVPSTPLPAPPPPAPEEDDTEDETEEDDDGKTEEQTEEDLGHEGGLANKENHKPRSATTAAQRSRRSMTSGETDDEEWGPGPSAQKGRTRRSTSRASTGPLQQPAASANASSRPADLKEALDKVVEAAVDEALTHFRYPTAWALRTLYDENSSNQDFLDTMHKVFSQTANVDTLEEFARLIQAKKKEGKKDNKACYYFVPPTTNSRFTPHKPKRAPYGNLVKFDIATLHLGQDSSSSSNSNGNGSSSSKPQKKERPVKAAPEPEPERDAEPEAELPPRKKRKSGRQHSEANSSTTTTTKMTAAANGVNGKANAETPSRKRTRARSVSSISSLSSARSLSPPEEIPDDGEDGGFDETPSRTSPAAPQPITSTRRRRSNAPRKGRNVSPSQPSSAVPTTSTRTAARAKQPATAATPSRRQSPTAEEPAALAEDEPYEMPAVVDSPLFTLPNSKKGSKSGTPTVVLATKLGKLDPEDPKLRLRRQARNVTNQSFPESGIRDASPQLAPEQEAPEEPATPATAPAPRSRTSLPAARPTPAPREGRSTRSALKRTHDDVDDQASPTAAYFPGSEAASTVADSRAGTPALRPAKKPRTGLRVKNSPMKKKNGTSAGIPRPSGERSSPVGNAPREDDNDDYCSSCGGNGELICCDGCTRSFHFSCVDPVLMRDAMPVEWFCNVCRTNRYAAGPPSHDGAFAQLLEKLDAKNSSAFRLPAPVRDHFEGVRTGADGEYEEITAVVKPTTRKKKADEDQVPDFFRIRDAEGNAAICHGCQKSSAPDRAIIPCSVCGIFWHLDCLDPPLAYPPVLRTWKCPLHADDLLVARDGILGPAHKYRKIKDAPVVRPTFTRGYVNNGYVDIEFDDSDNESGWRDVETYGRTVRLSEKGIKLDFLSRVRNPSKVQPAASQAMPAPRPLETRSLEEQRAALNLAQLSGTRDDGISTLINAMVSQADPSVLDIMARADPSHLADAQLNHMDQQSLRAILARAESMTENIRRLLASATPQQSLPKPAASTETGEVPAMVPSLTNSQSPDPESDNSANMDADASAMDLDAAKSPASPATTDDVPAMTQGEKTPVQGDQSPAAPLPLEETAPIENGSVPATPTKAAAIPGDEPVVLEAGGDGEKTLGEGQIEIE